MPVYPGFEETGCNAYCQPSDSIHAGLGYWKDREWDVVVAEVALRYSQGPKEYDLISVEPAPEAPPHPMFPDKYPIKLLVRYRFNG